MVIKQSRYNNRNDGKPIKINLDLMTYDILCRYVLQNNAFLRMEHLVNLRRLMTVIDYSTYENDPEKTKRVKFIMKALEARLENNINDRDVVLCYINGGLTYKVDFLDYNRLDLTKDEILYVHNLVSETLQYQFLYNRVDEIQDLLTRFKMSDFCTRGAIVQEIEQMVDELKTSFRHSKINDNSVNMTFSLRDGQFEASVTDTYNAVTNPSRRLITGMQGLNEMTGGGFESGRVYMLLGTSGVGKSLTLLNLIYQIKRYNCNYKPKDPTKTPCIVLLTMENTVTETITRLFDLVIENSHGMANYTVEEVIRLLREEGELVLNESSPIDIVIKYKANKSVDTSYLYTLYDDLYDEGYEMICLVQDHVKRIRSIYANTDLRLELGDVVNELKVFAADKDIPVLTNSHLNRDAAKILEDAARKSNQDAAKLLGKSNIGESMLMIDNLDMAIIINLDYDKDENRYMAFNTVKMRANATRTYIAQPFAKGSTIRLMEDFGGIPQFKETIHGSQEIKRDGIVKISGASSMVSDIKDLIDANEKSRDNAFNNSAFIDPNSTYIPQRQIIKPIEFVGLQQSHMSSSIADIRNKIKEPNISNRPIVPITFDFDPNDLSYLNNQLAV